VPDWFAERVRPVVAAYPDYVAGGTWRTLRAAVAGHVMAGVEDVQRRQSGAPPRVAAMLVGQWAVGMVAAAIATGLVRDGIVPQPGEDDLELLQIGGGYCGDVRLADVPVTVAPGHPWAGRAGVETVADTAALGGRAMTTIMQLGEPAVASLVARAGLGRPGLWAQTADTTAAALQRLAAIDGVPLDRVQAVTKRFLTLPGHPWRRTPELWVAEADGVDVGIQRRGSCCLFYQCDPEAADEPPVTADEEYLARFGDDGPRYCGNCLFRDRDDVEARTVFEAVRAR